MDVNSHRIKKLPAGGSSIKMHILKLGYVNNMSWCTYCSEKKYEPVPRLPGNMLFR